MPAPVHCAFGPGHQPPHDTCCPLHSPQLNADNLTKPSGVNDAIERTPIASKVDALAALDLIRDETIQPGHHLVLSMIAALRRYLKTSA
jgi:hypothetical protein